MAVMGPEAVPLSVPALVVLTVKLPVNSSLAS